MIFIVRLPSCSSVTTIIISKGIFIIYYPHEHSAVEEHFVLAGVRGLFSQGEDILLHFFQ